MSNTPSALLILPKMKVLNANCISGPLTWGFPSPATFTGFAHALSLKFGCGATFTGVGIVCHSFEPKIHPTKTGYKFSLSRNPLGFLFGDAIKKEIAASIIEEGKSDFTVSLVLAIEGNVPDISEIVERVQCMRIGGGSIQPFDSNSCPQILNLSKFKESDDKLFTSLRKKLIPGFALVDRTTLLKAHLNDLRENNPETTLLDALLDRSALKYVQAVNDESYDKNKLIQVQRKGWIVPIPVGYLSISQLYENHEVKNTRDSETPFRFVETAYTLGEWISPLKLRSLDDFLWFNSVDAEKGYYLVEHKKIYE